MNKLVLIRGIPGSGKSTLAKTNYPKHIHLEADAWMVDYKGEYLYQPNLVEHCHNSCLDATQIALMAGYNVVVSNTFIRLWELEKYTALECDVEIVTATGTHKSIHNVPEETILRMIANFEPYPTN